jgi:GxxExxY protein
MTKKYLDDLAYRITGAAIEVHKELGPGLLESVYHKCLKREFELRGIKAISELNVDIHYKGECLDSELRCDFLVEDIIVVELKAVTNMLPVFDAQTMSYMKLLKKPKGIMYNFHVNNLYHEGRKSFVNELYRNLPEE